MSLDLPLKAELAEGVLAGEGLGSTIHLQADLADKELVVNLLRQLRARGSGHREAWSRAPRREMGRGQRAGRRPSKSRLKAMDTRVLCMAAFPAFIYPYTLEQQSNVNFEHFNFFFEKVTVMVRIKNLRAFRVRVL